MQCLPSPYFEFVATKPQPLNLNTTPPLPATPPNTDMEAVAPIQPEREKRRINCQERATESNSQDCKENGTGDSGVHSTVEYVDRAYPYIPLSFIMANAVLQKLAIVSQS